MDLKLLERRSEYEWMIPQSGTMRVPAVIYASEPLVRDMDHKVFEQAVNVASLPGIADLHPYQPAETLQGLLRLLFELQQMLAEISGLPAVSLRPAAGAHDRPWPAARECGPTGPRNRRSGRS